LSGVILFRIPIGENISELSYSELQIPSLRGADCKSAPAALPLQYLKKTLFVPLFVQ
jgi:hypothetical protein